MTETQRKFVELEKRKAEVKKYFEELENACQRLAEEVGVNGYFQDLEGTVYKVVVPQGRFVRFEKIGYERTRRVGEKRGDLSLEEARKAGYSVE